MIPFTMHCGPVLRLPWNNIDTDQIIPARYLHRPRSAGYGNQLFQDLRFTPDGKPRVDFPLNDLNKVDASILLAGRNFGCGSSREHAVWALMDYGFRVVIAPDFGDIFFNNSLKNGLLVIRLDQDSLETLTEDQGDATILTVDLERQSITNDLQRRFDFDISSYHKEALLAGASDIKMTMSLEDRIERFATRHLEANPWIVPARAGHHSAATTDR